MWPETVLSRREGDVGVNFAENQPLEYFWWVAEEGDRAVMMRRED